MTNHQGVRLGIWCLGFHSSFAIPHSPLTYYNPAMSEPNTTVVTRFAPSPTGYLHIGGARTALFNWAMARRHSGRFLLRMEDTDRARSSAEAEQSIIDDLQWLGLDWDNDPIPRQSERLDLYRDAIKTLKDKGLAYDHEDGNGAVVFRMPDTDITFDDEVRGTVTTPAGQIEDFVIQKAHGFPTFHLAVVVDDADMGVTHVIRGTDHLTNTSKHIALQQALDLPTPTYAHMSLTVNPDGSKLGKRDKAKAARKAALENNLTGLGPSGQVAIGEVQSFMAGENDAPETAEAIAAWLHIPLPEINVRDFRNSGYLPDALTNFLGLLGWNPGNDIEDFGPAPRQFLADHWDLSRLVKADAKFDRGKLASFNADRIKAMPLDQLTNAVGSHHLNDPAFFDRFPKRDDPLFTKFCAAYQERAKTLREFVEQGQFLLIADEDIAYDFGTKNVKKVMLKGEPNGFDALADLKTQIAGLPEDSFGTAVHELIQKLAEEREINMGKLAQPLRVAVSGGTVTPPIDATLDILGKAATLNRIDRCLAQRPTP